MVSWCKGSVAVVSWSAQHARALVAGMRMAGRAPVRVRVRVRVRVGW